MYEFERGPIDSFDAYSMGLRSARCNGCKYERLKWELGDKFLALTLGGWVEVYELDAEPRPGQGNPQDIEGIPVRWRGGFMAIGHSDECYDWKPPAEGS